MAGLEIVIGVKDLASGQIRTINDSLGETDSIAKKLAVGLGALAAGGIGGISAAFGVSVKKAADFDQALREAGSSANATRDELGAMRREALAIGADTSKSASEAVGAIGDMLKAGMALEDVIGGGARAAVNLAEALGEDVAEAAELTADSLSVFRADGRSVVDATNLIAQAVNASSIEMNDFRFSLAAVGPVASQSGLTMQDFSIAIGLMGNSALKGSDAGTSLKTMLLSLTAPSKDGAKALSELGVAAFDAQGNVRPFRDILGSLEVALQGASDEQRTQTLATIFGSDAIRAANILLREGVSGWDAFGRTMGQAPGVAEQSAARLGGLNGALEQLNGTVETMAIRVGTLALPALTRLTQGMTAGLGWLLDQDWSTVSGNLGVMAGNIGRVAGALLEASGVRFDGAGLMGALNAGSTAAAEFSTRAADMALRVIAAASSIEALREQGRGLLADLTSLAGGTPVLAGVALKALMGLALANPVIAGVAAAAAGLYTAYRTNFLGIRDTTDNVIGQVMGFLREWQEDAPRAVQNLVGRMVAFVRDGAPKLAEQFRDWVASGTRWILDDLLPGMYRDFRTMLDGVLAWVRNPENTGQISDNVAAWTEGFLNWVDSDLTPKLITALTEMGYNLWPTLEKFVKEIVIPLNTAIGEISVALGEIGFKIGVAILDGIIRGIAANIGTRMQAAVQTLPEWAKRMFGIPLPSGGGGIEGSVGAGNAPLPPGTGIGGIVRDQFGNPVNMPRLASGGIVTRPTMALIGEAGPEAVVPLSRGGGVGGSVHIHLHGPVYGMNDFEDAVTRALVTAERSGRLKAGTTLRGGA